MMCLADGSIDGVVVYPPSYLHAHNIRPPTTEGFTVFDQGDATNLLKELVSDKEFMDKWGLAANPPKRGGGPTKAGCV